MSVLIEDSPRANLDRWIIERHLAGCCAGTVVSPFATPWDQRTGPGRKPSAGRRISDLQTAGVAVWFDPMTHALQMSGVGDFRYYDQYNLWNPERPGELSTRADRADHVQRVFAIQQELRVRALAPTVLLHTGLSDTSALALDLAREALECWPPLSVPTTAPLKVQTSGT